MMMNNEELKELYDDLVNVTDTIELYLKYLQKKVIELKCDTAKMGELLENNNNNDKLKIEIFINDEKVRF